MANASLEWLAGLLEGEGCFHADKRWITPQVILTMTDKDVVDRVASLWGKETRERKRGNIGKKQVWTVSLNGAPALECMLDIFPLLGDRRRGKISEILSQWEHNPYSGKVGISWKTKRS